MLVTLNVKNFAIIDNIQIDFNKGFTVLTGETGAGKSLIIDAISLLFGERASNDLIRYGESKATIEGVFSNYDEKIIELLKEFDIEYDENEFLIVKRELYATGKSICKINNQTITLAQLKRVSEYIGDIHSQLETFGLINPKNYLSFLKSNEIDSEISEYEVLLKDYHKLNNELTNLLDKMNENMQKQDFLEYQAKELERAGLDCNEEENLQNELKVLSNSENMKELITSLREIYNDGDVVDKIYESLDIVKKLESYDSRFANLKQVIESAYYDLDAVATDKLLSVGNYDFDERRFEAINERLGMYSDLKRKYKKTTQELIEYLDSIKKDLNNIENFDVIKADLEKEVNEAYEKTLAKANVIRKLRMEKAHEIENEIKVHLQDLQLLNAKFEIEFNNIDDNVTFFKDGIDEIDFMVSFNKGEPLKALSKTASGGELSRFMLALKTVLGDELPMQTKIFDEIDSGVSGAIAYSIGKKLYAISKKSQVLCITHLPQVAALADNHLRISKVVEEGRTYTKINILNGENRIYEIASMISNGKPTDASLNYAKELLESNK